MAHKKRFTISEAMKGAKEKVRATRSVPNSNHFNVQSNLSKNRRIRWRSRFLQNDSGFQDEPNEIEYNFNTDPDHDDWHNIDESEENDDNENDENQDQEITSIRFRRSAPVIRNDRKFSRNLSRMSQSCSISSESESNPDGINESEIPGFIDTKPVEKRSSFSKNCSRKKSLFFAPYGAWSESSVLQTIQLKANNDGGILQASWEGQLEVLEELLKIPENHGNINRTDFLSPLHLACANGHISVAQLLIKKGADVNAQDPVQQATPLMCAATGGYLNIVELLLENGALVNAGFENGKTALHWAVEGGHPEIIRKLCESGAKQNISVIYSETPIHIAAGLGDIQCLEVLIEFGGDTSLCKGPERYTALHIACEEGNTPCIRALIKASGTSLLSKLNSLGQSPLHIAAMTDVDSTALLLASHANPNIQDNSGRTPLMSAISKGSRASECVKLLLDYKADMNCQDQFGYSPLHLCALHESSQCASILLSRGADVTVKTNAGITALTLLCRKIPDVMLFLTERLNAAVSIHDHDPADPDCEVKLDFRAVVPFSAGHSGLRNHNSHEDKLKGFLEKPRKETDFLTCVLAVGYKKILAHPLSEAFLTLKWRRVRKFFWASLLFQIALVLLFTIYIINVYLIKCPMSKMSLSNDQSHWVRSSNLKNEKLMILQNENESATNDIINEKKSSPQISSFTWFSFTPPESTESEFKENNEVLDDDDNDNASTSTSNVEINTTEKFEVLSQNNPRKENQNFSGFGITNVKSFPILNVGDGNSGKKKPSKNDGVEKVKIRTTCELGSELSVVWILLIGFTAILAVKEIFQFLQAPLAYVQSSENWGQWALIGSVGVAAWPATTIPQVHLAYWQYPAAACGILLAWGLMLLQVGRFPTLGLYVQMLGKVAANFGVFILAYACLLIAFALAYCVLFPQHPAYSSVPLALLKVLTMMVGEVDYEDLFYGGGGNKKSKDSVHKIAYPISAHLLHATFVIVVTIVLMNLLVGLAVNDIQGLQKSATINRLSRQTALISRLESFIFSKKLQAVLPKKIGLILQRSALLVPSSYSWSYHFKPNDPRDKRLPKELKKSALRLASLNHSNRHSNLRPMLSLSRQSSRQNSIKVRQQQNSNLDIFQDRMERIESRLEFLISQFTQNSAKNLEHEHQPILITSIENETESV